MGKFIKPHLLLIITVLLLAVCLDSLYYKNRLYPGVSLKNIALGGKTYEEVQSILHSLEFSFVDPEGNKAVFLLNEIGIRPDPDQVFARAYAFGRQSRWPSHYLERFNIYKEGALIPLHYDLKEKQLLAAMDRFADAVNREPQDAYFQLVHISAASVQAELVAEKTGFQMDKEEVITALRLALAHPGTPFTAVIPGAIKQPAITVLSFREKGIEALISSFATTFDSSNTDRVHNIKLAAAEINNCFLAPGEIFSLNKLIGDTTPQKGYKEALTMQDGELVQGYGGGLCQVSTTLYNAALLANLEIIERHNHHKTIPYVAPGRDATIVYGDRDLKFRNNGDHYILINGMVEHNNVRFSIFGAPLDENVIIYTRNLAVFDPPVRYEYTADLPPGEEELLKGSPGYVVEVWKYVYDNDPYPLSKKRIAVDTYVPHPTILKKSIHD